MDGWAILKEIRQEWPAVRAARWIIFLGITLGAIVGFGVSTLWWSGTVGTLRERLSFTQDRLQVVLANPTNPAALVTKQTGRQLTEQDRECLVAKFKDELKTFNVILVSAFPDDESTKYGTQFFMLFVRMGYKSGLLQGTPTGYSDVGVMVGLKDKDNQSAAAKKFEQFLRECNLLTHDPIHYTPAANLTPEAASADFDLFIGPRE